jgi:cell wall-associated NlpC family hydrolase
MIGEAEGRALVVAEAMTWLGTPYHHRARLKGVGVDCAQLPLAVYVGAGLVEDFDPGDYPCDWHQHRSEERYARVVLSLARELDSIGDIGPGDVILWKYGRAFSHGALVIDLPRVIHASRKDDGVVLADIDRDSELIGRPARYFSFWGR